MKLLKLSNKKFFHLFIFVVFLSTHTYSNEPIDIWNLENKKKVNVEPENESEKINNNTLIDINYSNTNLINIEQEEKIDSDQLKLVGLYDPAENDL